MKSITKNHLSREKIIQLITHCFKDCFEVGEIIELKGGFFNSAYLIERLNFHDKIVLKVSVATGQQLLSYEHFTMETEVEVYKLIESQTTVPTPKLLAYDFSKKYISSNYFFMTALEGESMNKVRLNLDNSISINKELANYFAQLHQIKSEYFGYFSDIKEYQYKTWKEAFLNMIKMILSDSREHHIKLPYKRINSVLKSKVDVLDKVIVPCLVDYDLHPGNIFLKKLNNEYVVEGIIDFERAFWGDSYADFPSAFLFIDDVRKNQVFWHAYRKYAQIDHDITKEEEIRLNLYRLYIFTIMCAETYRYGFIYSHFQYFWAKSVVIKCLNKLEKL